ATIFYFLGISDASGSNLIITPDKRLAGVDAKSALDFYSNISRDFLPSGSKYYLFLDQYPIGLFPPHKYPHHIFQAIRNISWEEWEGYLIDHVTEDELSMLKYRQAVILADVALRGAEEAILSNAK